MVTAAPPPLNRLAQDWDWRDPSLVAEYPSATFSGIIPDIDHLENGGYHVSIEDLIRHGNGGDYSNSRYLDRCPPVSAGDGCRISAAMDMSMSPPDMTKHYWRVKAVYDNPADPRRQYIGYVNTWKGSGSPTRFDFQGNRILTASQDHTWHAHSDFPRAYIDFYLDPVRTDKAMRAYRSMILGQSIQDWLISEGEAEEDEVRRTIIFRYTDVEGLFPYWSHVEGSGLRVRLSEDADVDFLLADAGPLGSEGVLFPGADPAYLPGQYPAPDLADDPDWNEARINARFGAPLLEPAAPEEPEPEPE